MPVFDIGTIVTERLALRLLTPADAPAMFTIFSDPEVMRYGAGLPWTTMAQADEYVVKADADVTAGAAPAVFYGLLKRYWNP